jgi:hypothetical protein
MSALDSRIDELYQGPLDSFTASRNRLAKTLTGEEKERISALAKPLVVPWVVNQTYWQARPAYDALLAAGKALRSAQVGGLQGRATDIRFASDRHEEALKTVVAEALKLATAAGVQASADELRRMFEAASTQPSLPAEHGRFVKPLAPAGFEALTGLSIAAPLRAIEWAPTQPAAEKDRRKSTPDSVKKAAEQAKRLERERAAAERKRRAAIARAKTKLAGAVRAENRARFEWERKKKNVEAAERVLSGLMSSED